MSDQSTQSVEEVEWRDVPGLPGYRASTQGFVETQWLPGVFREGRRGRLPATRGEIWLPVRTWPNFQGYLYFYIPAAATTNGKRMILQVHRAVCMAFHGLPPDSRMEVAHFPIQRHDANWPSNLQWATTKQNQAHRKANGTDFTGSKHPQSKLTEEDVLEIRELRAAGWSWLKIAKKFKVAPTTVKYAGWGVQWKHVT